MNHAPSAGSLARPVDQIDHYAKYGIYDKKDKIRYAFISEQMSTENQLLIHIYIPKKHYKLN